MTQSLGESVPWPPADAPAAWNAPAVDQGPPPPHQEDGHTPDEPTGPADGYAQGTDTVVVDTGEHDDAGNHVPGDVPPAIDPLDAIDPAGNIPPDVPGPVHDEQGPASSDPADPHDGHDDGDGDASSDDDGQAIDPGDAADPAPEHHRERVGDMPDGTDEHPDLDRMPKADLLTYARERYGLTGLHPRQNKSEILAAVRDARDNGRV